MGRRYGCWSHRVPGIANIHCWQGACIRVRVGSRPERATSMTPGATLATRIHIHNHILAVHTRSELRYRQIISWHLSTVYPVSCPSQPHSSQGTKAILAGRSDELSTKQGLPLLRLFSHSTHILSFSYGSMKYQGAQPRFSWLLNFSQHYDTVNDQQLLDYFYETSIQNWKSYIHFTRRSSVEVVTGTHAAFVDVNIVVRSVVNVEKWRDKNTKILEKIRFCPV
jgi:hypothetical protein